MEWSPYYDDFGYFTALNEMKRKKQPFHAFIKLCYTGNRVMKNDDFFPSQWFYANETRKSIV